MGIYTQSSETSIDDGTLSAVYDIAETSTLLEAVVKIRGEHTIDYYSLTLLDNSGISTNCSAEATYSAFSDETVIVIRPGDSNSIGGTGNTWKIEGPMTIEGVAMAISIKAPEPSVPSIETTPDLPIDLPRSTPGMNVTLQKSDGSAFTLTELQNLNIQVSGMQCILSENDGNITVYRDRDFVGDYRLNQAGQTEVVITFWSLTQRVLESISLGS